MWRYGRAKREVVRIVRTYCGQRFIADRDFGTAFKPYVVPAKIACKSCTRSIPKAVRDLADRQRLDVLVLIDRAEETGTITAAQADMARHWLKVYVP